MFVHIHLHAYCAPELLNSLAATSLPATKYEHKHCKALKVVKLGVICFLVLNAERKGRVRKQSQEYFSYILFS